MFGPRLVLLIFAPLREGQDQGGSTHARQGGRSLTELPLRSAWAKSGAQL